MSGREHHALAMREIDPIGTVHLSSRPLLEYGNRKKRVHGPGVFIYYLVPAVPGASSGNLIS
jgi:hypothetical protein